MSRKYTPENITHLDKDEIFVFGSNLQGFHGGGAARVAYNRFGAVWGQGVGLQGQCYAIPTMQGGAETIKPYVDEFIKVAREWDQNTFYVTRIGCGIAGFTDEEIAPLFDEAYDLYNVRLPKSFVEVIERNRGINANVESVPMWQHVEFSLRPRPNGFHLVTDEIVANLPRLPEVGLLNLFIKHTSAALTINENADPDVRVDMKSVFDRLVKAREPYYRHTMEGDDDMPAHAKASLIGPSVTIPISNGRLNLGTWQGIYLCEFRDHGGPRRIVATIAGK